MNNITSNDQIQYKVRRIQGGIVPTKILSVKRNKIHYFVILMR